MLIYDGSVSSRYCWFCCADNFNLLTEGSLTKVSEPFVIYFLIVIVELLEFGDMYDIITKLTIKEIENKKITRSDKMIRKIEKKDYDRLVKLVYQVHELHYKNRPDIYIDGNPLPIEYFESMINDENALNFVYE